MIHLKPSYDENVTICDGNAISDKTTYILMGSYSGVIFLAFIISAIGLAELKIPKIENKTSIFQVTWLSDYDYPDYDYPRL